MNPLTRFAAVIIPALVLSGCGTMKVTSYTEPGVDWSLYHTYTWGAVADKPTGDPRLDNNPFFHERIQAEVERTLTRRGFTKTYTDADVSVRYRASITDDVEENRIDRAIENRPVYNSQDGPEPYVFQSGTLLFELTDARTNRVLWRGWAMGSVDGVVNNQAWMEEKIGEIVARVFAQLPGE
jgi:hypothetical protein